MHDAFFVQKTNKFKQWHESIVYFFLLVMNYIERFFPVLKFYL